VIYAVFREMAIGEFRIRINNRKVLRGLLQHFEIPESKAGDVLRILDKMDKESTQATFKSLADAGVAGERASKLYELLSKTKGSTDEALKALRALELKNDTAMTGLQELAAIVEAIERFGVPRSAFAVDLGVVRGLDYYTGTIYETTLTRYPEIGSICSGGRYDDLASYFTSTRLPGVGISIGLTRLFSRLAEAKLLQPLVRTPAEVLVTTMGAQYLEKYLRIAAELRAAGVNTEVYLEEAKLGNQLTYADRKGFRVALIAGENEFAGGTVQIKDLNAKTQRDVPGARLVAEVKATLGFKDD
jgi:histidyl-tRNA synthetase